MRSVVWLCVLAGVALWHLDAGAQSPALQVSPVSIELPPGRMSATLNVTNTGGQPTTVQLRSFQWRPAHDDDGLDETDALEISPPITEIGAGETQIFRLVLRAPAMQREATYRLLLDQLPPPSTPGNIRISLRLSIPVFAVPDAMIAPDLSWRLQRDADGARLIGANAGGQHARVLRITLTDAGGRVFAVNEVHGPYVLPGGGNEWSIADAARLPPQGSLQLNAVSDAGPMTASVTIDAP